jgi:hypothetical protein
MNLYKVTITRFVLAPDPAQARELALSNNNPLDVELVEKPETLSDVPNSWRSCQPYGGAPGITVEQHLVSQIAGTREYREFCVQPFKMVSGNVELTNALDPLAEFGVYARYQDGMAVHLGDFPFQYEAESFKRRIERARQMQRNVIAPDAHLEKSPERSVVGMQYEDQVSGMLEA